VSTLAVDGSGDAVGSTRTATVLRYLDLILLIAALPVFLAADLPMAGYIVVAGVWILLYGIEIGANRAVAGAVERRDRRAAMGWTAGSGLARAWVVTLSVLLVGLTAGKPAGLAAAVLALILFTVHLGSRVIGRMLTSSQDAGGGG
jgi:hypothetical protein